MRLECPKCLFARDIPDDKIPANARLATCPKCAEKFVFRDDVPEVAPASPGLADAEEAGGSDPSSAASSAASHAASPAADQLKDRLRFLAKEQGPSASEAGTSAGGAGQSDAAGPSFFSGFLATALQVLFNTAAFFQAMPKKGLDKPLLYNLLIEELVALIAFLWQTVGLVALMGIFEQFLELDPEARTFLETNYFSAQPAIFLFILPFWFAASLFVTSAILHVALRAFGAAGGGFEATFRAKAYAATPMLLSAFPLLGHLAGFFWSAAVLVIGLKHLHRTSYTRVLLAFALVSVCLAVMLFPMFKMALTAARHLP